ncbi:MAG: hypothetical protein R3F60_14790 [bacterium]
MWVNDAAPTAQARAALALCDRQWQLIAQGLPIAALDRQAVGPAQGRLAGPRRGRRARRARREAAADELRPADELDAVAAELDALADELRDTGDTRPRCARCDQLAAGRRPVEGGRTRFNRAQLALPGLEGPAYVHTRGAERDHAGLPHHR